MATLEPLPSMGRGRGGVSYETRFAAGDLTPTQPSPIEGEGFRAMAR
jgi:hypothetical protein